MCSSCPKASSVQDMRCKVFPSVRSGKGGTPANTEMLPIAWAADTVPERVQLITALQTLVGEGFDLCDAVVRSTEPATATRPTVASPFPSIPETTLSHRRSKQLRHCRPRSGTDTPELWLER